MRRVVKVTVLSLSVALAATAFNLSGCGEDETSPTAPKGSTTRKVVLTQDNFFSPKNVSIAQGDTIVWFNSGSMVHTATSGSNGVMNGVWNSGNIGSGGSFTRVFNDSVGVYNYYCIPHWSSFGMVGTVTVTP
jgi:plastocyanin